MGLFNLFKKEVPEVEEIKTGETTVADQLIDFVISFVRDKENISVQLKDINKIRKLSVSKRETAYLPVYLSLEKFLVSKKPTASKEYFSRKVLRKQKEFTKEDLRKQIREKIDIKKGCF